MPSPRASSIFWLVDTDAFIALSQIDMLRITDLFPARYRPYPVRAALRQSVLGELQGSDRLDRSVSYMNTMRMRHPTNLDQSLVLVPGADHDSKHVLANRCSLPVLFSDSHEFPCASNP